MVTSWSAQRAYYFHCSFCVVWRVFQRKKRWHLGRELTALRGPVTRKVVRADRPLLAAKIGPGCQTWSGYINLQETVPCLQTFV